MKILMVLIMIMSLASCKTDKASVQGSAGQDGLDGRDGSNGEDGVDGKNGLNGKDGKNGVNGSNGSNGKDGKDGANGSAGKDGDSCQIKKVSNGVEIKCGDTVAFVKDGKDGEDGQDGQSANAILNTVVVDKNTCTQVGPDLYIQNIQNGYVFDVYMDSSCKDFVNGELNEYCDNVATSFGVLDLRTVISK